ncbi:MAG: TldD/PmbA family protein [Candidatus Bathyarchaeia archaeon]
MVALDKEALISLAEKAVGIALVKGADNAEAYVYSAQGTSVGIERGQITKSSRAIDQGLGIRLTVHKAVGFAYTNTVNNLLAVEKVVENALSAARASKPDAAWVDLPEKSSFPNVQGTFDRRVAEMPPTELVYLASTMLDVAVRVDNRVLPVEGGAAASCIANAIANSNGVSGFDHGTIVECSLACVAKEGSKLTPVCFEFNAERSFDVDAHWIGAEVARLAVSALNTKRIETKNTKIILTQFALQELLYYTLMNAVKADNIQRGQSALKDKLGEQVASENVTIYDDGLFPGGLCTAMFDGEGVPHQKTLVVEKGFLRGFLYDNYTAKKEGKLSTGNAARAGYLSTPSIEVTNFHMMPGDVSAEDLLNEVDDGLLIYYLQGAHSSNPVSGDFSVVATPAWKIRKGEIVHCSRSVMIAGNIFEVLKNIGVIASNERKMGQLIAPWILVENVRIIGK